MSTGLVALLASISVSVWVYTKLQNRTGYGNNPSAIIGAGAVFIVVFIVLFTIGHAIAK